MAPKKPGGNKKFFDPNIPRKGKVLTNHLEGRKLESESPPLFSLMEFNLSGLCNRKCVFCPRTDPKIFPNVNEHIPVELYERIMKDLAVVGYDGMILYSAFGEPLLYKSIETLLEITREHCPEARVETVTDGDFVTPDKLRALFGAGLDTLLISCYDGPEQLDTFQGMMAEVGLTESQVILRKRWFPPKEQYGITLSNRSGMVEIPQAGVVQLKEPLKEPCYYPFYQVLVDYDGSVLICSHDWGKKLIVGNLNDQSIHELWNNRVMMEVRQSLANANRNFAPCNKCDVNGILMGRSHFDEWKEYYKIAQAP